MQRRQFLATLAALPAAGFAGRLFATPTTTSRFLLVFLRGGYDCANLLVPYSSDFYYESRPSIAIARPDSAAAGALRLDADWALAPAVREALEPLYAKRQLAFVPFAGTPNLSRSHFETQDDIEHGLPENDHADRSGFLARLSGALNGVAAPIAFTQSLPLSLQGGGDVPNISLARVGKAAFDARQSTILAGMYKDTALADPVAEGLALRQQVAGEFADEMMKASRGAVNAYGFTQQAPRIAQMMRDKYRIGFIDVGGWDTHVGEGGAQGALANNLGNLSRGLAAFAQAMGDDWKDTTVVVVSEFGRTFRENGNKGTDHGHGSVYWVLGGGISGGRVAGEQVRVTQENLLQNRDFPVLNDYRGLLGGVFARLWGMNATQLAKVFPQTKPEDLRLV
ncbi:MAG: DUF1501 domain-containing protein [Proteobacteria bacterium]|nr:DUF1501 domain-containing protein [Pseudomonadota bacterium]